MSEARVQRAARQARRAPVWGEGCPHVAAWVAVVCEPGCEAGGGASGDGRGDGAQANRRYGALSSAPGHHPPPHQPPPLFPHLAGGAPPTRIGGPDTMHRHYYNIMTSTCRQQPRASPCRADTDIIQSGCNIRTRYMQIIMIIHHVKCGRLFGHCYYYDDLKPSSCLLVGATPPSFSAAAERASS